MQTVVRGKKVVAAAVVAFFERKNIHRAGDDFFLIESFDDFAAESFNVKSITGNKMLQPLNGLSGAGQAAGAAADGFVFLTDGVGAAFGADMRKNKFRRAGRSLFREHADHLRNNVARPLNDNRVAEADVFSFDFVFVVQGGVGNNHPADVDRFQISHRCQGAGAPHLNADVANGCQRLFGGEFVGNRPARRAG